MYMPILNQCCSSDESGGPSSPPGNGSAPKSPSPSAPQQRQLLSFTEAMEPWVPFVFMSLFYMAWIYLSPSDILEREPRILFFSLGVIFSNIAVSASENRVQYYT